jgi:hypothetical protein
MDLSARYLGLDLRNPLVASASPLSVPADADGAAYERAAYVTVMQEVNAGHGPW